jgi:hypothetical protein
MATEARCAGCGMSVTPAAAFMTEVGELCNQCFARYQNQQVARERAAAEQDQSLSRSTARVAGAHFGIWAAGGRAAVVFGGIPHGRRQRG